jgi:hypothetical protein
VQAGIKRKLFPQHVLLAVNVPHRLPKLMQAEMQMLPLMLRRVTDDNNVS